MRRRDADGGLLLIVVTHYQSSKFGEEEGSRCPCLGKVVSSEWEDFENTRKKEIFLQVLIGTVDVG